MVYLRLLLATDCVVQLLGCKVQVYIALLIQNTFYMKYRLCKTSFYLLSLGWDSIQ